MHTPFYGPDARRAIAPEIITHVIDAAGAMPVSGLQEVTAAGDARVSADGRISNFQEMHDRREWLLPLHADGPLVWRTAAVPQTELDRVLFVLSLGFGNGSPLPQPSGQWDVFVNDRFAVALRVVNHRQLWRGPDCALAFDARRVECAEPWGGLTLSSLITNEMLAAFGPALLSVPTAWLTPGEPAEIRVEPQAETHSTRWLQVAPPNAVMQQSDFYGALRLLTTPHPAVGDYQVYFGDIHTHSGQVQDECQNRGCGYGTWVSNYAYARGAGGLDFYALTEHEWQVDPDNIGAYLELADRYNEDGRLACLPAFEHTNLLYGHRNVYFRDSGGTVFNTNLDGGRPTMQPDICATPDQLWAAMEATGVPFITVPHHPSATSHPCNLDVVRPAYDRLIEVYSCWGSSEYRGDFPRGVSDRWAANCYRDAMRRGLRCGVVAGADGHDGHPGNAQSPGVKHHHLFHFCGSGRTAVLAPELTREQVFDAMYARRCYATTGPPIVLDVTVNDAVIGSELQALAATDRPEVKADIRGTAGIDHVRVMKNDRVVHTLPAHGREDLQLSWVDDDYDPAASAGYWLRVVQVDHESAWTSPVWIG